VAAVDEYNNESTMILDSCMPVPVEGFLDLYKQSGGQANGGFCFIATAAYGSPMAAEVVALRDFRDRQLATGPVGRLMIATYYRFSPPLAQWIARHEGARTAARTALWPVVRGAEALDALPPGWALPVLGLGLLAFNALGAAFVLALLRRRRG
jgi:hypothetical protein